MNRRSDSSKTCKPIKVGIYGRTKAGKTRFLYQLLSYWQQEGRLLDQSESCREFLRRIEDEIKRFGGPLPTSAATKDISVKVQPQVKNSPQEWIFRDLRGELLEEEVDDLSSLNRDGVIPTQVRKCDCFLFFFDPTSEENPAEIDTHSKRELERASKFLEYVLRNRQNRVLPVVFVLTHLDVLENNPVIRKKADDWIDETHRKLCELYDANLAPSYPKKIVDRKRIFFYISSLGRAPDDNRRIDKVIKNLHELVVDSRGHLQRLRKTGRVFLIGGLLTILIVAVLIGLLWYFEGSAPSKGAPNKFSVAEMSERDILDELTKVERFVKGLQSSDQLTERDAKQLNTQLQWLVPALNTRATDLTKETLQKMRALLEDTTKIIQTHIESNRHSLEDKIQVLEMIFGDLGDLSSTSSELAQLQTRYWELRRDRVVEELAQIIKCRRDAGSGPVATLQEVIDTLRDIEQKVGQSKVFGSQSKEDLVNEIKTTFNFCEDRLKSPPSYPATFSVIGATLVSDKPVKLHWRLLGLQKPDGTWYPFGLMPKAKSNTEIEFNTKQPQYSIQLGLGTPVLIRIQKNEGAKKWSAPRDFDLTGEPGPLAPLGMPLIPPRNQSEIVKTVQWEGMELRLKFKFPQVPSLIWDAIASSEETKS